MFKKVLVANRGEIAVRIIRALRELGIMSVAIYSEADKDAYHTQLADEAICVGPSKSLDSYQNQIAVLSAALVTGADAIHPGYGFLSENADFANLCETVGIKFIGPSAEVIHKMGNKHHARMTMKQQGIPITPGSDGLVLDVDTLQNVAQGIGYPLMIKASDGGGGKGMRRVDNAEELIVKFQQAQAETQSIYGNKDLYMEKIISPAKHIEVQLLGDEHGHVIHLGERDCSIQRHHQKVIEIAPAVSLNAKVREAICQSAVQAAKAIGYYNAGTIEFLVDEQGQFYFMEMNTRLQVEHPVSEMITGVDIVKWQILIAAGEPLTLTQNEIQFNGVAVECRLNAEDPQQQFRPSSGMIQRLILPSGGLGLRVESGIYSGYMLSPFYDAMIAKIVTHGDDLSSALTLMQRSLFEVVVDGISTNVELLEFLCRDEDVRHLATHTKWLESSRMTQFMSWLERTEDSSS